MECRHEPYRVGNWLPDFVLTFESGTRYFMEAKPLLSIATWLKYDYLPKNCVAGKDRIVLLGQGVLDGPAVLRPRPAMKRRRLLRTTIESRHKRLQLGWLWDAQSNSWMPWIPKPEGVFALYHIWTYAQSCVSVDDTYVFDDRRIAEEFG